jgi:hypothetical protein
VTELHLLHGRPRIRFPTPPIRYRERKKLLPGQRSAHATLSVKKQPPHSSTDISL